MRLRIPRTSLDFISRAKETSRVSTSRRFRIRSLMIELVFLTLVFAYLHALREATIAQQRQTALIRTYERAGIPATILALPDRPNPPLPPEFDPFRHP